MEETIEPRATHAWWQRRWVQLAIIFGVWTCIAFIFTNQLYFPQLLINRPIRPWGEIAREQFVYPYLWALATPLILWFAGRYPVERPRVARHLCYHLSLATVLVVAVMSLWRVILYLLGAHPEGQPFLPLVLRTLIYNSTESYGVYVLTVLLHHAYHYYNRFRQGELRASRLEARLSQAQLQALKMQLHPHFLFNTLHSISSLVHKDPDAADRMISRLGDFLRMTLDNSGAQEVQLKSELEFLRCYLEIERVRFRDRLTTEMDIDPRALDARVPNLILQPIVENAIRHGVAPRSSPGLIEILAKQQNGTLRIEVKDNGPGLAANQRAEPVFRRGLGLANTKARLEQLYGEAHRFELAERPGGGLVVAMEIPARREATPPQGEQPPTG